VGGGAQNRGGGGDTEMNPEGGGKVGVAGVQYRGELRA